MKASKLMIGLVLAAFVAINVNAQPKSEIPDDNRPKMNWSDADTLYTFEFNDASKTWQYFQREIRRFDNMENPVENFVQMWKNNNWANYLRVNYTYDEKGNEIEEITQEWDNTSSNWMNAQLKTTTYTGKNKSEILFQQWKRPTNEWFNMMKYLIKYNNNDKEDAIVISLYNGVTRDWDNHKRFSMEFSNPYGPPSTVVAESWSANNWKTDGKYDIRYNGRSQKTFETRYTWNTAKKNWLEGVQLEMVYDRKGNQTEYIERKYDINNTNWMNFNRFTATYNEEGYMTEKVEYGWNRATSQWEEKGRYKFTTEIKI